MKLTTRSCSFAATAITFGLLTAGASAALFSVSLNDFDGYQISGTVDTTTDVFTITSWTESGGFAGWVPDNSNFPITVSARDSGGSFDVPDNWNGTISNSWGFISDLSNDALVWVEGDYTEPNRHFGWGGGISSTGSLSFFTSEGSIQWAPDGETDVNTHSFDEVTVTLVPEPSSALMVFGGSLLFGIRRRLK